jgi:membrane fusion protein, multidrug efflux system
MSSKHFTFMRRAIAALLLMAAVLGTGTLLGTWKRGARKAAATDAANQPEPTETVELATVKAYEHRGTTTAIGTVLALQSVTLKTEVSGTVVRAPLEPGRIVQAGKVLLVLDSSVEQAELRALEAQARLLQAKLERREQLSEGQAIAREDLDQARAQRDVAEARVAQLRAQIAKKTIRAPFRARVGLSNVHRGQYLNAGETLTTLQGVADQVHVDFPVAQTIAAGLDHGSPIEVRTAGGEAFSAEVIALDARVDPITRNATVRARLPAGIAGLAPGASVRVVVPAGEMSRATVVPVSALRKGPDGDHVWIIEEDSAGGLRAHERKVLTGPMLQDWAVLLGGVQAGERVAATGSFKLREGVRVEPLAARPPASD